MATVTIGEESFEIEDADVIRNLRNTAKSKAAKAGRLNGVDVEVIELLAELSTANFEKLIPDPRTRALLSLLMFLEGYEVSEAVGVLQGKEYDRSYFDKHEIWGFVDVDPSSILREIHGAKS